MRPATVRTEGRGVRPHRARALIVMVTAVIGLLAPPVAGQPDDTSRAGPALLLTVSADPDDESAGSAIDIVDDQGRRRLIGAPAVEAVADPAGRWVASISVTADTDPPSGPVQITPLDGGPTVTSATSASGRVAWTPDGTAVLATTDQGVVRIDPATGTAALVPTTSPGDRLLDAGHGTVLVVRVGSESARPEPVLLHTDGRDPVVLWKSHVHASVPEGRIAPDGTQVAFTTLIRSTGFTYNTLHFAAADGSHTRSELTPGDPLDFATVSDVSWAPDSSAVLALTRVVEQFDLVVRSPQPGPDGGGDGPGDRTLATLREAGAMRAVGWSADGDLAVHTVTDASGLSARAVDIDDGAILGLGSYTDVRDVSLVPGRPGPPTTLLVRSDADRAVTHALAWSTRRAAGTTDVALLGRADGFADSLASGGPQGVLEAPLLLTHSDRLDDRVLAELDRLGVQQVVLLGGEAALTPAVADALTATGIEVRRVAGADRTATAVAVADLLAEVTGTPPAGVLLARAFDEPADATRAWADSLAAGARAAALRMPVLLTATDTLSPATAAYLRALADLPPPAGGGTRSVTIIGGTSAIDEAVAEEIRGMGLTVQRLAGDNRFATAVAVSVPFDPALSGAIHVIDGTDPLGWAAGFPATAGQIVLVDGARIPPETQQHLLTVADPGNQVVCGPDLTESTCAGVTALGQVDARPAPAGPNPIVVLEILDDGPSGFDPTGLGGRGLVVVDPQSRVVCLDLSLSWPGDESSFTEILLRSAAPDPAAPVQVLDFTSEHLGPCRFDVDPALIDLLQEEPTGAILELPTLRPTAQGVPFRPQAVLQATPSSPTDPSATQLGLSLTDGPTDDRLCVDISPVVDGHVLDGQHVTMTVRTGDPADPEPGELLLLVPDDLLVGGPPVCVSGIDPAVVTDLVSGTEGRYVELVGGPYAQGELRGELVRLG